MAGGCFDGAEEVLDKAYERWARALLSSPHWRSGLVASGELGWHLSGYMRGLVDMGKKRAQLWQLGVGDLYGRVFRMAHSVEGPTWAKKSLGLLAAYGLPDFPPWPGCTVKAYGLLLEESLACLQHDKWVAAAAKHCIPVLTPNRKLFV